VKGERQTCCKNGNWTADNRRIDRGEEDFLGAVKKELNRYRDSGGEERENQDWNAVDTGGRRGQARNSTRRM